MAEGCSRVFEEEVSVEVNEETSPPHKKAKHLSSCSSDGCDGCELEEETGLEDEDVVEDEMSEEEEEEEEVDTREPLYFSDSEEDYIPDGQTKMDEETWSKYMHQVTASEGFDIEDYPGNCIMSWIVPVPNFYEIPYLLKIVNDLAMKAIEKFNSDEVTNYKFVEVKKVNKELVAGYIYYITFVARNADADANDESALKTFQARVWKSIPPEKVEVFFCRLKAEQASITSN